MAILYLTTDFSGQDGRSPRIGSMTSTDDLAAVTTPGYIPNSPSNQANAFSNGDLLAVTLSDGNGGITSGIFNVSIGVDGTITLAAPSVDVPVYVQQITPGASAPNKAVVLDSGNAINSVPISQITTAGTLANNQISAVVTLSTAPASGTCAAQFRANVTGGVAIAYIAPILFYISDVTGAMSTAATGITALTNGVISQLVTGRVMLGTTTAGGLLGITLTASAGTYYVTFLLPNGQKSISSALVVNA